MWPDVSVRKNEPLPADGGVTVCLCYFYLFKQQIDLCMPAGARVSPAVKPHKTRLARGIAIALAEGQVKSESHDGRADADSAEERAEPGHFSRAPAQSLLSVS